ncbi:MULTISPECIES: hypothetical protein [unclassified Leisingera]|uniref:hypothetical protein n=1 Tax=unclassified Leisingera TaxID=2614906 RepID=UPI0002FF5021|nr:MULTISPECIES: hypothetical protein [unclassified Leisingera]KIC26149.1 hypothetical protein RA23_04245 [Leisingera sp. ANG-S3]KIC55045.1 hypothetical protein RA22_03000 [Leisingera sp. ANG-S]KID08439.1 hypothetical protein GC1_14930 [Leisingera sp. ANG1]
MQRFKSWSEIEPTATKAERKLKQAAVAGKLCICGPDGQTPPEPEDWSSLPADRHIRADVLRFFLRGGCENSQVTEVGVGLAGVVITGELNLRDCEIPGNMLLHNCRFQHGIYATRCNAKKDFRLRSCKLPFLSAGGLKVGGQLNCKGAEFQNKGGEALNLQDADIGQTLSLDSVKVLGAADLNGLKTGGQLDCEGAEFQNEGGKALNLQNAVIGKGFLFRDQVTVQGSIDLAAAHCGDLVDDPDCWPDSGHLILDGFTYRRLHGPTDARTRLNWLAQGDRWNGEFYPQPYKQLAKVLHDMGHEADAMKVRVTLACKLRAEARKEVVPRSPVFAFMRPVRRGVLWVWHGLSYLLTAHGYRPWQSLFALTLLIVMTSIPTKRAWEEGSFAPNSSVILNSQSWATYASHSSHPPHPNPAQDWSKTSIPGRDWESFHPLAYAADVVIPIINFGQTDAWAPSTERGTWGYHLWWARWVFTTLGWIVTALGAAALTGIIRRE